MKRIVKQGYFDYDTLTVKFGGALSTPQNIFTAQAVKVPDFNYTYKEREDAGGGAYYNNWVTITKTVNNAYIILKEDKVIGWMIPYAACHKIKSELRSLDECPFKEIVTFAKSHKTTIVDYGKNI
jgi:hypothetical protein